MLAIVGIIYWQQSKNAIIENKIENAVSKKSDNLYSIKYDSSFIDELNGNASFYNVSLLSDSTNASSDSKKNIYQVQIGEVAIRGANLAGLLTGNRFKAKSINIIRPVFTITRNKEADQIFTKEDTLALYEQILGKYKSIEADEIIIDKGTLTMYDERTMAQTQIREINLSLKQFKIDSTKDYENLVSYFIRGVNANIGNVAFINSSKDQFTFNGINFNAAAKLMTIKSLQQVLKNKTVTDFRNISLNGLETDIFLRQQKIEANELSTDGGLFTLYRKKGKGNNTFETDSSVFDKAKIGKVSIGKTKVVVVNRDKPEEPPITLNNVQLTASDIPVIEDGSLNKLIANSNWIIKGDGLQTQTENKSHNISIGSFVIDKYKQTAHVKNFSLLPTMSEAAFVKSRKVQEDYIELQLNNVSFTKLDLQEAFAMQSFNAAELTVEPVIKIFNDRTLPRNLKSKIPTDPAMLVKSLPYPINVRRLVIKNGYFSYRERGMISAKTGILFFDKLNAVIFNVTNTPAVYNNNPAMMLQANSRFMGKADFATTWKFPLNKSNGPFTLNGKLGDIEGTSLNVALEPQAMVSIKKGNINSFVFNTVGDYSQAKTNATILYEDLKLSLLKMETGKRELQKKSALSFLANIFISDRNPDNGRVRQNEVEFKRDSSRSFFYLVSQSFFLSIRKSMTGKNNVK